MDPWHDLHTWSRQYRQEALREARERPLATLRSQLGSAHPGDSSRPAPMATS
jgi:hypothetical protein